VAAALWLGQANGLIEFMATRGTQRSSPLKAAKEGPAARSSSGSGRSGRLQSPVSLALLLVALVIAAYWPALHAGFIWDDDKYVTENPMLTAPEGLRQIWFAAHTQSQYFPLVYTTFRLERVVWGLHPLGYHLVNVLLHAGNALLVWAVLRRLAVPGAWLAAAIFALHPVQVESVAWVTELKNLESLLFYLLAVVAWLSFVDSAGRRSLGFYFLALAACLLALFAKTTACTLPTALVLVLWLRSRRAGAEEQAHSRRELFGPGFGGWPRALQILPFVLAGVALGLVSVWWEGNLGTYNEETRLSFSFLQRALIASRALWFYAAKLVWPVNLAFSYRRWEVNGSDWMQYLPLAGCLGAAVLLWIWRRKLGIEVISGVVFFVAALAPLLGFISLYTFQYSFVADHYQYTASIGLIAVFAGTVATGSRKGRAPPFLTGAFRALLLAVLGCLTWQQCGAYLNAEALWRDTLAKNPESWMAHYNLAIELQSRGAVDEAVEHYRLALLLNPRHAKAQNNLGLILASKGNLPEAIACYQAALQTSPDFASAHNNLAVALAAQGNYGEAVIHLQKALRLEPHSLGFLMNLGGFLKAQGKTNDAFECYLKATRLFPGEVEVWRRFGAAALDQRQLDQAISAYRRAVQLASNRVDLLVDFGNALASRTNYDEAISTYRQALAAAPENSGLHYNLGVVLDLRGKPEEAKTELREALRLKPDFVEARQQLILLSLRQGK
jgi:tetratricopeptide (TPR) repeat protein